MRLDSVFGRGREAAVGAPSEYLLRLVQVGVAAAARRVTIEGSRYGTAFMHDGTCLEDGALADLLLGRPLPSETRLHRSTRALAAALDACLCAGAKVELNVRRESNVVHVEMDGSGCTVDASRAGRFAAHWDLRVVVKGMRVPFGEDVCLVRERCRYAPASMVVDERPINVGRVGGPPLAFSDVLLGRCIACVLPFPFLVGLYPRHRHVVEIRWLPVDPQASGIGLPQPADANLAYERAWDEQTWPLLDDPGLTRPDAERNRHRRSFLIPDGDDQRRIGVYQGVMSLRPRGDAPSRMLLTMDGVCVEEGDLDGVRGVDVVVAADALGTDASGLRPLHDGAWSAVMGEVRERAALLERALSYEFEGADRDLRVAHALSGRAGARILRW